MAQLHGNVSKSLASQKTFDVELKVSHQLKTDQVGQSKIPMLINICNEAIGTKTPKHYAKSSYKAL